MKKILEGKVYPVRCSGEDHTVFVNNNGTISLHNHAKEQINAEYNFYKLMQTTPEINGDFDKLIKKICLCSPPCIATLLLARFEFKAYYRINDLCTNSNIIKIINEIGSKFKKIGKFTPSGKWYVSYRGGTEEKRIYDESRFKETIKKIAVESLAKVKSYEGKVRGVSFPVLRINNNIEPSVSKSGKNIVSSIYIKQDWYSKIYKKNLDIIKNSHNTHYFILDMKETEKANIFRTKAVRIKGKHFEYENVLVKKDPYNNSHKIAKVLK